MSQTAKTTVSARCSEVYFAEVDFPAAIQPRLVIEYSDGLKIIIASEEDLHLAADFISQLRRRRGGRS
jgi:hypothetical protein